MNTQYLIGVEELKTKIARGQNLFLAGDEKVLEQLPRGNWVGGTIPYFVMEEGGVFCQDKVCVFELPSYVTGVSFKTYDAQSLFNIYKEAPDNGFTLMVIPASSKTHLSFALNARNYAGFASRPLIGWISGVAMPDMNRVAPKVFDGYSGRKFEDAALAMHVSLPWEKTAKVGILNIFEPGNEDTFLFPADSFTATEVTVNGQKRNFAEYLKGKAINTKLPLVANYNGVMINISIQSIDESSGEVRFYAPVFEGVEYRVAKPVADYIQAFSSQVSGEPYARSIFSCNCIVNYLCAGLEGKKLAGMMGPMTFGEVAYQLLNQTLVFLKIEEADLADRLRDDMAFQRSQLLETLLDTIPYPVYYKNMQGKYIGCNREYEKYMNKPREQIVGKTVYALRPRETADFFHEKDLALFRGQGHQIFEWSEQDESGAQRHLIFRRASFTDSNGRLAGLIGLIADITKLKHTEEMLKEHAVAMEQRNQSLNEMREKLAGLTVNLEKMVQDKTQEIEDMLRQKEELMARLGHDIKTPLTPLMALLPIVAESVADAGAREMLDVCIQSSQYIQDLVYRTLNLFVVNSPKMAISPEAFRLAESADIIVRTRAITALRPDIRVINSIDPSITVTADRLLLREVFENLFDNAFRHMPEHGELRINALVEEGLITVSVADTGEGIAKENLKRIFDEFYKVDSSRHDRRTSGLGLSICRRIVEQHGGTIWAESAGLGKGTAIKFTLPQTI